MICKNCGKQINDDLKYCPYCGKKTKNTNPLFLIIIVLSILIFIIFIFSIIIGNNSQNDILVDNNKTEEKIIKNTETKIDYDEVIKYMNDTYSDFEYGQCHYTDYKNLMFVFLRNNNSVDSNLIEDWINDNALNSYCNYALDYVDFDINQNYEWHAQYGEYWYTSKTYYKYYCVESFLLNCGISESDNDYKVIKQRLIENYSLFSDEDALELVQLIHNDAQKEDNFYSFADGEGGEYIAHFYYESKNKYEEALLEFSTWGLGEFTQSQLNNASASTGIDFKQCAISFAYNYYESVNNYYIEHYGDSYVNIYGRDALFNEVRFIMENEYSYDEIECAMNELYATYNY